MLKKIIIMFVAITVIAGLCGNVNAAELKTSLNIIQNSSEKKYLDNDQGYIEKSIVNSSPSNGEVSIEVKVSNTSKASETSSNDTEIILLIDVSPSMDYTNSEGKTRKSIILESSRALVNSAFNTSSNVKIGLVEFSDNYSLFGPIYAASVVTKPTSNKEDVLKGLSTIESTTGSGTNIQKGLIKAEETFSKNASNKVLILLTDGCPNGDAKSNHVSDSGMVMTNEKYLTILENTKNELINVQQQGITMISLMAGVNSGDIDTDGNVITSTEDDIQAIEKIFGTEANPTAGKFYNAKTTDINKIMENDITKDVQAVLNSPMNTVKIVDYFPEDITKNFDFSYVGNPSVGTVSDSIDEESKTITWDIGTLRGNEVATLVYKLKLKDMNNTSLLNKIIATNEKVVLTYQDTDSKDYTVTLTSSPKIQLAEVKDGVTNNGQPAKSEDSTVATSILPNAGVGIAVIMSASIILLISAILYKKYHDYKDV